MEIHLGISKQINTTIGQFQLEVMVEPNGGRVNPQTGRVMEPKELEEILEELADEDGKLKVKAFKYLPQTMEVLASRIWEEIEESMTYQAKLSRLKLTHGTGIFVIYDGRPEQWRLQPVPQPQPKSRRRKARRN